MTCMAIVHKSAYDSNLTLAQRLSVSCNSKRGGYVQESKQQQKELAQMQASLRTIQAANQERLHRQQAAQNQLTHLRVCTCF